MKKENFRGYRQYRFVVEGDDTAANILATIPGYHRIELQMGDQVVAWCDAHFINCLQVEIAKGTAQDKGITSFVQIMLR